MLVTSTNKHGLLLTVFCLVSAFMGSYVYEQHDFSSSISQLNLTPKYESGQSCSISYHVVSDSAIVISLGVGIHKEVRVGQENIYNLVNEYRRAIKTQDASLYQTSELLYKLLIQPIEQYISNYQALAIKRGSFLKNIPFECLQKNGQPLLNKYSISYMVNDGRIATHKVTPTYSTICAMAPFYDDDIKQAANFRSAGQLNSLPYTGVEVHALSKIFRKFNHQTKTFLHEKATKQNFVNQLSNTNIVHIATHGGDQNSNLHFRSKNNTTNLVDSCVIDVFEMERIEINASLVVLSACKTAVNSMPQNSSEPSLAEAFLNSGAQYVIGSLWNVNDKITKDFMISFYTHFLKNKVSYAEALRLAKLDCVAKGYLPIDWASFILMHK